MKSKILALALVASSMAFSSSFAMSCQGNADIKQADILWQDAFASNNVDKIVNRYASDAILLATLEPKPITNENDRRKYFTKLFNTLQKATVVYQSEYITPFKDGGGQSSGLYTFKGISNGKPTAIAARYTFVYKPTEYGCVLVAHHSSLEPEKMK